MGGGEGGGGGGQGGYPPSEGRLLFNNVRTLIFRILPPLYTSEKTVARPRV